MNTHNDLKNELNLAGIYTDFNGLTKLGVKAAQQTPESIKEVSQQFEALFIQMMLKSMRQAGESVGSVDSDQTAYYQEMFDKQIALDLSAGRGIGLASVLERQLGGRQSGNDSEQSSSVNGLYADLNSSQSCTATSHPEAKWTACTPESFIRDLWPHASQLAPKLDTSPQVLIAQSALETGWGKNMIKDRNGQNSLNFFGIKADNSWEGDRTIVSTLEYRDGIAQRERQAFRSYPSITESMNDYMSFLKDNPRYQHALENSTDANRFTLELQGAGYSTDPVYAKKIMSIMNRESFTKTVAELLVNTSK